MVFSERILGFGAVFAALRRAFQSVVVLALLTACGQKGPLFLPVPPQPPAAPIAATASSPGPAPTGGPASSLPAAPTVPASAAR